MKVRETQPQPPFKVCTRAKQSTKAGDIDDTYYIYVIGTWAKASCLNFLYLLLDRASSFDVGHSVTCNISHTVDTLKHQRLKGNAVFKPPGLESLISSFPFELAPTWTVLLLRQETSKNGGLSSWLLFFSLIFLFWVFKCRIALLWNNRLHFKFCCGVT